MDDIKDKLINAIDDGLLEPSDVIEKLLSYIDDDIVEEIIDDNDWKELIGIRELEDSDDDDN